MGQRVLDESLLSGLPERGIRRQPALIQEIVLNLAGLHVEQDGGEMVSRHNIAERLQGDLGQLPRVGHRDELLQQIQLDCSLAHRLHRLAGDWGNVEY